MVINENDKHRFDDRNCNFTKTLYEICRSNSTNIMFAYVLDFASQEKVFHVKMNMYLNLCKTIKHVNGLSIKYVI